MSLSDARLMGVDSSGMPMDPKAFTFEKARSRTSNSFRIDASRKRQFRAGCGIVFVSGSAVFGEEVDKAQYVLIYEGRWKSDFGTCRFEDFGQHVLSCSKWLRFFTGDLK